MLIFERMFKQIFSRLWLNTSPSWDATMAPLATQIGR